MNGKEAIFEEITAENFLKLIKGIKPHTENLYEPKPHKYKTSEQKILKQGHYSKTDENQDKEKTIKACREGGAREGSWNLTKEQIKTDR